MDIVGLISWLAAGFGMATALPQLVKIWRTRVTTGVSTRLWQLSICNATAWVFHGFWIDSPALVCHNEHLRTAPTMLLRRPARGLLGRAGVLRVPARGTGARDAHRRSADRRLTIGGAA